MGSLPYVPYPHDDTKGGARPPLDSPAYLFLLVYLSWLMMDTPGARLS